MYQPYPELSLEIMNDRTFALVTPWMRMTLQAEPWVMEMIQHRPYDFTDAKFQGFLEKLLPYPLVYFFENARGSPEDFPWDLPEVSAPSAYTVLRRERMKGWVENVRAHRIYEVLDRHLANTSPKLMPIATLLRQNHYITETCDQSLAPAAHSPSALQTLITDFRNSEKHHDRLIAQSLRTLGYPDPAVLEVFPSARAMMEILRQAAETDLFVFAVVVEAFEGGIKKTGSGLLAGLLDKNPTTKAAAAGLRKHHTINEVGQHAHVGLEMAKKLGPISIERFKNAKAALASILEAQTELVEASIKLFNKN